VVTKPRVELGAFYENCIGEFLYTELLEIIFENWGLKVAEAAKAFDYFTVSIPTAHRNSWRVPLPPKKLDEAIVT